MSGHFGAVYKIENRINGRVYIGQTTRSVTERYGLKLQRVRNRPLKEDVERFGYENFDITEVLEYGESYEELNALEKKYIKLYDSTNPEKGYNTEPGGGNHAMSEDVKRKIGSSVKGERNGNYGKRGPLSPNYTREMRYCSFCGKEIWVMQTKLRRSKHHYCSVECKKKDAGNIQEHTDSRIDVVCPCCGKVFRRFPSQTKGRKNVFCSNECKLKHFETYYKGENNPNYGNHKVAGDSNGRARKVMCIETGKVYGCARDADREFGFLIGSVGAVCRGEQKTTHGLHFQFCE